MDNSIIIMTIAFLLFFTVPYVLLSVFNKNKKKDEEKNEEQ